MLNVVAEFTERSLFALICCTFVASSLLQTAMGQNQQGVAAGRDNAFVNLPPAVPPFKMGVAKSAADYAAIQKQALEQMNFSAGFLTQKMQRDYQKYERDYRTVLRQGVDTRDPESQAALDAGLNYRTFVLSDPSIQNNPVLFESAMKSLFRDLANAAPISSIANARSREKFRLTICEKVFQHLEQQITEGNFKARSAAIEQLLNLEVVPARNRQRIKMYDEVHTLLVSVLTGPNQPDAVKVRAANVVKKYLQKTDAIPQIQMAFAEAVASEVKRKWLSVPYLNSLVGALEWVKTPRKIVGNRAPVVFCSMVELMQNKEMDIYVRCRAARVLGRAGYDRGIVFDPLAWGTADLTKETALEYAQSNNPQDPKWARCGWFLYTAFHHETGKETDGADSSFPKGYLNRAPQSATVRGAYENSVPVLAHIMDGGNPRQVGGKAGALLKWLGSEKPASMKCDPLCPAIN